MCGMVLILESISLSGVADSRIRDFHCVYFNKEYMECTWEPGTVEPVNSKHYLYYW